MFSVSLCPFQNRAAQVSPQHRPTLFQAGVTQHLGWVLWGWHIRRLMPSREPPGTTLWFDTAPWCRPSCGICVRQEVCVCVTNGVLVAEKYASVLTEWIPEHVAWIFYRCCGLSLADLFLLLRSRGYSNKIHNLFLQGAANLNSLRFQNSCFSEKSTTKKKTFKAPNVSSELKYNRNTHFYMTSAVQTVPKIQFSGDV